MALIRSRRKVLLALLVLFVAGIGVMGFTHVNSAKLGMIIYGYPWFAMFYATLLILGVTSSERSLIGRFLRIKLLGEVGVLAYGVYLFHHPINGLLQGIILNRTTIIDTFGGAIVTCLALVATIAVAKLSWVYFEKPLVRRGHRTGYGDDTAPLFRMSKLSRTVDV
jgi:peptidoglycan/LPS O-acetylase OafA/YrhL